MLITILALLLLQGATQEFLQNEPITFALGGGTTYVPSTGGVAIPGYTMTLGFERFQWLGNNRLTQESCS